MPRYNSSSCLLRSHGGEEVLKEEETRNIRHSWVSWVREEVMRIVI